MCTENAKRENKSAPSLAKVDGQVFTVICRALRVMTKLLIGTRIKIILKTGYIGPNL